MTKLEEIFYESTNAFQCCNEDTIFRAAKKYADYKVTEALELAAENAKIEKRSSNKNDTGLMFSDTFNNIYLINKDSILNIKLPQHDIE